MEEKKKKNIEKETETKPKKKKTSTAKKTTSTKTVKKSAPAKDTKKVQEKTATKKVEKPTEEKKKTTKKPAPAKKAEPKTEKKKQEPKVEPKQQPVEEKENLEKTIIFDGNQSKNIIEVVNKLEEDNIVLEDKVIKRSKARKAIIILLVLLIFAIIAATTYYVVAEHVYEKESKQTLNSNIYKKASKNYKSVTDIKENTNNEKTPEEINYENIETITLAEFEKKALSKEDMTILIASTTCYPCITFEPVVNEVYGTLNKKIYRINVTALTTEETARFRTYYAFAVTPTIFTVKEGIVVAEKTGIMTNEELTEWVNQNGI